MKKPASHGEKGQPAKVAKCGEVVCPVEGYLQFVMGRGGCIFCHNGVCTASHDMLTMFTPPRPKSSGSSR
ncbi:MAG: hypothetical protein LAP87_14860 [Acidobacteriia bacterium]|nr:hypothetical protein [Terriglobia bacterium]